MMFLWAHAHHHYELQCCWRKPSCRSSFLASSVFFQGSSGNSLIFLQAFVFLYKQTDKFCWVGVARSIKSVWLHRLGHAGCGMGKMPFVRVANHSCPPFTKLLLSYACSGHALYLMSVNYPLRISRTNRQWGAKFYSNLLFGCSDINQAVSKATTVWSDFLGW